MKLQQAEAWDLSPSAAAALVNERDKTRTGGYSRDINRHAAITAETQEDHTHTHTAPCN